MNFETRNFSPEHLTLYLAVTTFLNAELGFLGVVVKTFKQTPFRWGFLLNAGTGTFLFFFFR